MSSLNISAVFWIGTVSTAELSLFARGSSLISVFCWLIFSWVSLLYTVYFSIKKWTNKLQKSNRFRKVRSNSIFSLRQKELSHDFILKNSLKITHNNQGDKFRAIFLYWQKDQPVYSFSFGCERIAVIQMYLFQASEQNQLWNKWKSLTKRIFYQNLQFTWKFYYSR